MEIKEPTRKHKIPEAGESWMKKEMRKPFRVMFWILVVCMGFALVSWLIVPVGTGDTQHKLPNKPAVSEKKRVREIQTKEPLIMGKRALKIGEGGILWNDHAIKKHPNIVPVCVDKETMDAMYDALCAGDEVGFLDLWLSDRSLNLFAGTRVLVIKRDFALSKVRILEGTHAGRAGWVPYEWVVKEGR